MTITLTGYNAAGTEKAIAFVESGLDLTDVKPLWLPRKKIASMVELDELSKKIQFKGERVQREAIPVRLEVDKEFLARIGRI